MSERVVVDTGPLVAIVRKREEAHHRCVAAIKELRAPLLTCWPVLTEAAWLLRHEPGGLKAIDGLLQTGAIRIVELDADAFHWIINFLEQYRSVGAQLADAALMFIAEQERIESVLTLDRRDFSVYRTSAGRALTILPR